MPRGERRRNISHDLQEQLGDFLRFDARRTRANDGARLRAPHPLQATRTIRAAEAPRVEAEHEIAAELVAAAGGPGAPVAAEPTPEALLRRPPEIQPPAEAERPTLAGERDEGSRHVAVHALEHDADLLRLVAELVARWHKA